MDTARSHESLEHTVLGDLGPDDELEQNVPNSYNTRNIMVFVLLGLALIAGGFFLSLGGNEDDQGRLQVSEEAKTMPQEARPPDPREHRTAAEAVPGLPTPDPPGGAMTQEELDALLGGHPGQRALAGNMPLDTRTEYELQRQLAFQQTLGVPTRSSIRPLPGQEAPGEGIRETGQGSRRQQVPSERGDQHDLPLPSFLQASPAIAQASHYEAGARTVAREAPPGAPRPEGPQIAVRGPFPPHTIAKGTLIPIVLESSVHSDIGGMIIARTTTDVYDRTRRHILIPRGAEVISSYGSVAAVGQNRLDVAASRLNLPDGRYVDFEDAAAYDPTGRKGLSDRVDRHLLSKFGSIAVLSLTGVAVSVASGNTRGSDVIAFEGADGRTIEIPIENDYRSPEDIAAQRIIGEINRVISKEMDRVLSRPNTIELRSGLRGVLILGDDVDMVRPYYEDNLEADPFGHSPFDVRPGRAPGLPPPPHGPTAPAAGTAARPLASPGSGS